MSNAHGTPEYNQTVAGQFAASTPTLSAWVSANAGSGKTKVLIDRVARLLLNGVKPDAILCVTYTKAAASEMQARLFKLLGGWCVADDGDLSTELSKLQKRDIATYNAEELGKARELFAHALETPGGLRIETIHAFCGRLLRRFPLEARVSPGFKELDDSDGARLWDLALVRFAEAARLDDPNLAWALETAALVAGAQGLGGPLKSLLSKRGAINQFINQSGGLEAAIDRMQSSLGAPDENVDAIIAKTMGSALPRERLKAVIPALLAGKKTDAKTGEILSTALLADDANTAFNIYQTIFLTQAGAFRASNPYTADAVKTSPDVESLFQMKSIPEGDEVYRFKTAFNAIRTRETFERSAALLRIAHVVFSNYAREKLRRAALDFDDLIERAATLLNNGSMAQWVLWKLDGGLSHVLLDEAQDTSPDQWKLLNALTQEFFSGEGAERENPRTLFVVGDEKQSIYSFQGADPERFLSERQSFSVKGENAPGGHAMPDILMSFRSAPQILQYVDETFKTAAFAGEAPFSIQPPAEDDLMRHTAFWDKRTGCVELWPVEPPEEAEDASPWDAPLDHERETSPKGALAERIAGWIDQLIRDKQAIHDGDTLRPARPGDFLILVRGRTGGLFDALIQALKRHGLPVAGADRIDLLDSLPVQDMLNLIRFVLTPEDDLTLAEILTGPFGGLDEDDHLFPLAYNRGEKSLWSRLQASDMEAVTLVRGYLDKLLEKRHLPPFEFLTFALEHIFEDGKDGWLKLQHRLGTPAREPVTALVDRAAAFDASGPSSLQLFISAIEREGGEVKRELSGPQDEVRVMTVHGSKGLEAPIVILPDTCAPPKGASGSIFVASDDTGASDISGAPIWAGPAKDDTDLTAKMRLAAEARELREHRRLLYVALTRAQDRLLICGAWRGKATAKQGYGAKSWFDICQSAMDRLVEHGAAQAIEIPDGRNVLRLGQPQTSDALTLVRPTAQSHLPDWINRPAAKEERTVRYAAPSSLLGEEPAVLPPFVTDRPQRLERGRLIHTLLQTLPDTPPDQRRARAQTFLARDKTFSTDEHQEMIDVTMRVLEDPLFDPIFTPKGRAEAPIVGAAPGKLPDGMMINGRVDRLVVDEDKVLIVDFKTDRPAPSRVEDVGKTYLAQMAAYRAVLESAYPDLPVRCVLVWTDGPQFMELSADALDAALTQITPL